jgi:hypothetical protein
VGPLADFVQVAAEQGQDRVFPMAFPNTVVSVHAGHVATLLGCTGPAVSVCGEHAGLEAFVQALALLDSHRADRVVAIGADAAEPVVANALGVSAAEGAAAVRISLAPNEEDVCLAAVTGWSVAGDWERLPADVRNSKEARVMSSTKQAGAADGAVAVAQAAAHVAEEGAPVVVLGPCGVSGVAGFRLEPA